MQLELFKKSADQIEKIVNVASVPQRSPFRYPGGKTWFVPTFRKWMQSHKKKPDLLVEPFAGGGIIGLTAAFENLAKHVLLIEIDPFVASVWKVLIEGNYEKLAKKILNFELTMHNVKKELDRRPRNTDEMAFQTILRNRISYGGIMAPGSGLIKNGENGKGILSRWYPATLAKRILAIGEVRKRIFFYEGDSLEIIKDYLDDVNICFFIDPPYTAAGKRAGRRLYLYHNLDHKLLMEIYSQAKGDCLFTYDESREIMELALEYGFKTTLISMKNTHHAQMKELIVGRNFDWLR